MLCEKNQKITTGEQAEAEWISQKVEEQKRDSPKTNRFDKTQIGVHWRSLWSSLLLEWQKHCQLGY